MKLVLAIVHDDQANDLMHIMSENDFSVTKLATSGGFLRTANTTLICGTEADKVSALLELIERNCKSRTQVRPSSQVHTPMGGGFFPLASEVVVGGATCFVLDVDQFCKF